MKYLKKFNESVDNIVNDDLLDKFIKIYGAKKIESEKAYDIVTSANPSEVFYDIKDDDKTIIIMVNSFSNFRDDVDEYDENPIVDEIRKDSRSIVSHLEKEGHKAHLQIDTNSAVTYFEICIEA